MTFASPASLLLSLLLVPLLLLWWRDERRRAARHAALVSASLLVPLVPGHSPSRSMWRRALLCVGFLLTTVALSGPQWGARTVLVPAKGLDVLFAIDVSRSMRARDVKPDRLERAKAEIGSVLDRLGQNRVGIVAFAGSAFLQCPLTTDKEAVRLFMNALSPETVPQGGTSLKAGLEVALLSFRAEAEATANGGERQHAGRIVVVVTDGEDHEGDLDDTAKALKDEGIQVMLIGVGSPLGEPIPVTHPDDKSLVTGYLKDRTGNTVMTRMNPGVLQQVASAVGGQFIDGTNAPDLGLRALEASVGQLEKRDLESRTHIERDDHTLPVAAGAAILLSLSLLLPERRRSAA